VDADSKSPNQTDMESIRISQPMQHWLSLINHGEDHPSAKVKIIEHFTVIPGKTSYQLTYQRAL